MKKWWELHLSKEETVLFEALARHPEFVWRSLSALQKDTRLDQSIVLSIIDKYHDNGIILSRPKEDGKIIFAYWENVREGA